MNKQMTYEIIRKTNNNNKRNKLIELGHMIRGTRPTKGASNVNGKPTLKLRNWRTLSRSKSGSSIDLVRNYHNGQKAAKLRELGKMIKGL
jgi:hypothetical protein